MIALALFGFSLSNHRKNSISVLLMLTCDVKKGEVKTISTLLLALVSKE